jgi:hypothetical protein
VAAQTCEVVTKGRLSPALVCGLEGFDLVRVQDGKSYLVGTFASQARLFDMLEVFRDLNIEVVSIDVAPIDRLMGAGAVLAKSPERVATDSLNSSPA